ncbi:flagellar brake protein [Solimonas soli]|uniref:flagellar brake protein n=1 Tax=Solimonas soli TaxID=413479 RepID=UPI0004826E8C|nr:flagellar brake protein [Solimonas soli]
MPAPDELDAMQGLRELRGSDIDAELRRLCRYHSLLTVRRSGDTRSHASAVLAIQRAYKQLLLDALPDGEMAAGTALHVYTRIDGAELVFSCTVSGTTSFAGEPALVVSLPDAIRRRDRRAARRLPVAVAALPRSTARLDCAPTHISFEFEIVDLSTGGVGARLRRSPGPLLPGDRLELQLQLPAHRVPVSATLCVHRTGPDGGVRLGMAFAELQPRQLDQLSAALLQIERYRLRNRFGSQDLG